MELDLVETYDPLPHNDLKEAISEERRKNLLLEDALAELQANVEELTRRMDQVDNESNEWRTRFENQLEINEYLQVQFQNLAEKIEKAKEAVRDVRAGGNLKALSRVDPDLIKEMEVNKSVLEKQLKNFESRLDQESKAYHRSNKERKDILLELDCLRTSAEAQRQPNQNMIVLVEPKKNPKKNNAMGSLKDLKDF